MSHDIPLFGACFTPVAVLATGDLSLLQVQKHLPLMQTRTLPSGQIGFTVGAALAEVRACANPMPPSDSTAIDSASGAANRRIQVRDDFSFMIHLIRS